jgi:transcriptional regulator with XRE-family HTH domain
MALRDLRKERGLSQEDLAFESGYHSTYIGQLERGKKSPSLRTIVSLANALDVPPSELLRRIEGLIRNPRRRQEAVRSPAS